LRWRRVEIGEGLVSHLTISGWTLITPSGKCRENEGSRIMDKMVNAWILERRKDIIAMDFSRELQSNQWLD